MKNLKVFIFIIQLYMTHAISAPHVLEKIAAVVNNDIIFESEINGFLNIYKDQNNSVDKLSKDKKMNRKEILDKLILERIILQIAEQKKITVLNDKIEDIVKNIANENNMTVKQFDQYMMLNENLSFNDYREQIKRSILVSQVRNEELYERIKVLPQEVESLTTQLNIQNNDYNFSISSILIPFSEKEEKNKIIQAKELSDHLIKLLESNVNFNKLKTMDFTEYKIFPQFYEAESLKIKKLPLLFSQQIFGKKVNNIIGPIRSTLGFHIMKINNIDISKKNINTTKVKILHFFLKNSKKKTNQEIYTELSNILEKIKNDNINVLTDKKKLLEDFNLEFDKKSLKWILIKDIEKELQDIVLLLNKGEIRGPVHSSYGWSLIQLVDLDEENITNLNKNDAYHLLFDQKIFYEEQMWEQELLFKNYIDIKK